MTKLHDAKSQTVRQLLEQGATLPSEWYRSEAILNAERERIFRRSWQYVGLATQLSEAGQYMTTEVAGVPVVIVRTEANILKAHVNICPHRQTEVAYGCGRAKFLQCPYHAWTFDLDGQLKAAPDCDEEDGFEKQSLGLQPALIETWGPFMFVNLDTEASPLSGYLAQTNRILAEFDIDIDSLEEGKLTDFDVKANWKILAENYLECYHCPLAHKGFSKIFDVSASGYRLEAIGRELISYGPLKAAPSGGYQEPHGFNPVGDLPSSVWILLWPNLCINILPGHKNLSFYYFDPVSPERTKAAFQYFYPESTPSEIKRSIEGFWDSVGREDMALVESVQRSVSTGILPNGRLVLKREKLIQQFLLLTEAAMH